MKTLLVFLLIPYIWVTSQKEDIGLIRTYDAFEKQYIQNPPKDTTLVLNFWATWCKPCIQELPYFLELDQDSSLGPIKVVLVSLDLESTIESRVKPFVKQRNIKSEVVVLGDGNTNSWINKVDSNWSGAIPATLILKNGKRGFYEKNYHSKKQILKDIKRIK